MQGVVEHDPVVVVDDLRLVTELDRRAERALGNGPGVAVVQAHPGWSPPAGCFQTNAAGSGWRSAE